MMYLFIAAFFTGFLTKLVDLKYDNKLKINEIFILVAGFVYGFLIAFVISKSWIIAPLWLGIVLGLIFTKKIDAFGHYIGIGSMILFLIILGIPQINIFLSIFFTLLCVAEEIINDKIDKIKKKNLILKVLKYRPILEITALIVSIITGYWIIFSMLLTYDVAYILTNYFGIKLTKS